MQAKRQGILGLFLKFSIGSWLSAALSFFTTPVVTALIVPSEFGRASMFNLAYSFALQIVLLGADQSFVRKFYDKDYENNRSSLLQNCMFPAVTIGMVLGGICILLWKNISLLLIQKEDFQICLLLACTIVIGIFERYAVLVVRMYKKGLLFSLLRIIGSVVTFLVIVLYAHYLKRDMYAILYSILVPLTVTSIVAITIERKLWFGKFWISKNTMGIVLRYGMPFIPTFLAYWVFEGIDKIALRKFSSFEQLGLFTAAFKIVALLSILQVSFSTFWTPVAFEAYEKGSDEAKKVFKDTFSYLSLALFSAAIAISASKDIIMLFFDKAYHDAGSIMPFLLLVPVMYTMSEVTVGGINFKNRTHLHFIVTIIVAFANIVGNSLLVPRLGAKGAAISTGLAYILFFYFRSYFSNRLFPIDFGMRRVYVSIVIFLIDALIQTFYSSSWWTIATSFLLLAILVILYRGEIRSVYRNTMDKMKFA